MPLVGKLLSDEEWNQLQSTLVQILPDGPWVTWRDVLPFPREN